MRKALLEKQNREIELQAKIFNNFDEHIQKAKEENEKIKKLKEENEKKDRDKKFESPNTSAINNTEFHDIDDTARKLMSDL